MKDSLGVTCLQAYPDDARNQTKYNFLYNGGMMTVPSSSLRKSIEVQRGKQTSFHKDADKGYLMPSSGCDMAVCGISV
eukprot:g2724.t1